MISVLQAAASTPFGNYTDESLGRLREYTRMAHQDKVELRCYDALLSSIHHIPVQRTRSDVTLVELGFDQLPDKRERDWFQALPTTFALPPATIDSIVGAGWRLLRDNREFQKALRQLRFRPVVTDTSTQVCLR